jgi:23S rRNA-/tRNA-specific pseudouridylate synthase
LKDIEVPRVMLHSTELRIEHPDRGELMTFEAPLPRDFEDLTVQLG